MKEYPEAVQRPELVFIKEAANNTVRSCLQGDKAICDGCLWSRITWWQMKKKTFEGTEQEQGNRSWRQKEQELGGEHVELQR
jgi:hypothetical protein